MIKDCAEGKRSAQFELYQTCYSLLKSICIRYAKDDLEVGSLLNMGFYKILKGLPNYSINVPFEAWCRKIMINHIIDEFRANKKLIVVSDILANTSDEHLFVEGNSTDEAYDAESLLFMIRKLPEPLLSAFNLFAIDGYKHEEIAQILGCSVGTSKWYVNQARKKLQEMLAHESNYYIKSIHVQ